MADTCATATDLAGLLPYSASINTTAAVSSTGLPSGSGYGQSFETTVDFPAWFTYTPTSNQRIVIDTAGSSYDTYVQAYFGGCGVLTPIDSNDDRAAGTGTATKAYLTLDLTAGTPYYFVVGTFAGAGGTLAISIAETNYPIFRSINPVVSAGGPLSVNVPGSPKGPSEGDLVFVLLGHKEASYSTPPSGFTLVDRTISGSTRGELYVKTAGANEIALSTYNFTLASTGAIAAVGLAFAVAGGTIDAHSVQANASGASGSTSITATNPYSWVLSLAVGATYTPPSTFSSWATGSPGSLTMLEIEDTGTLNGSDVRIGFAAAQLTPAGATGASSWSGTSGDTVGFLLAIGAGAPSSRNLLTGASHTVQGSNNMIAGAGGTVTGDKNAFFNLSDTPDSLTGDRTFKVVADEIVLEAGGLSLAKIFTTTVTLTDAQIKALPTTPITLVAATGANTFIKVLAVTYVADTAASAYTNLNATYVDIHLTLGTYYCSYEPINDSTVTPALVGVTDLLGGAAITLHENGQPSLAAVTGAPGYAVNINHASPSHYNQPLQIAIDNNGSGNLTGGNAANSMKVIVLYAVLSV
jgi:hypothetical protein